ncbi:hypothetical protein PIB30_010195 [Stylosanthes scabra]|uniref:F-box protein n=1 Tax=Stylosanthes scabra TaxID=79078 RepID=A0ABU6R5G7_9FABA|nr:hypothetical protein [Stylosanthes scabra]
MPKSENFDSCILLKQQTLATNQHNMFLLSGRRYEDKMKLDLPPPVKDKNEGFQILGSSVNGTICLGPYVDDECGNVVFWNPTTDEFKDIPFDDLPKINGLDTTLSCNGFGYDPLREDYILIRTVGYLSEEEEDDDDLGLFEEEEEEEVEEDYQVDVGNNKLTTTLIREYIYDEDVMDMQLVALLDRYVATITLCPKTKCIDISILGEVGVNESWVKLFTVGPLSSIENVMGIGIHGDILLRKNDVELVSFDLGTQEIQEIGIKGLRHSQTLIYEKNFQPIGRITN